MRVTRLHCPQPLAENKNLSLSTEHAHHLINVLRHSVGDKVHVFNAADGEFEATLESAKKSKASVSIGALQRLYEAPEFSVHLCLGVSRGDRMDYGIQKSVELGVTEITPVYSEFGERKIKPIERLEKKIQHWQRIAENASEQCGRLDVPTINDPLEFYSCVTQQALSSLVVMDSSGTQSLSDLELANDKVTIFTGPEGGFSPQEIERAKDSNGQVINLGPRVLRTETAPVAALAILQHRFGDM